MSASAPSTGLRILIVEDEADNALSLAILLRLYGHAVEVAPDGLTALQKAGRDKPEVVLLDLGLPGMCGYDLARQLRRERPKKTPLLIAVTGYGREEDRRRSLAAGIDLHLLKPVDTERLQALLQSFQRAISEPSNADLTEDRTTDGHAD